VIKLGVTVEALAQNLSTFGPRQADGEAGTTIWRAIDRYFTTHELRKLARNCKAEAGTFSRCT